MIFKNNIIVICTEVCRDPQVFRIKIRLGQTERHDKFLGDTITNFQQSSTDFLH